MMKTINEQTSIVRSLPHYTDRLPSGKLFGSIFHRSGCVLYVSSDGTEVYKQCNDRIKRGHKNYLLRLKMYSDLPGSYLFVDFKFEGVFYHEYVHQLVLRVFVGECPKGCSADHIDRNVQNNDVRNLRWISTKKNCSTANTRRKRMYKYSYRVFSKDGKFLCYTCSKKEIINVWGVNKYYLNNLHFLHEGYNVIMTKNYWLEIEKYRKEN